MKLSTLKESPYFAEWAFMVEAVIADGVDVSDLGVTFVDEEKGEYLHYYKPGDETKFVATAPDGTPMERISTAKELKVVIPDEIKDVVEEWKHDQASRETSTEPSVENQG